MINIKKAIFGSTCLLGCSCDEHNDDKFVRMTRKERMTKPKEHRNMMVGMMVYILVLTVLCATVNMVEEGEILSAISLMDENEMEQDITLLKPKTGTSGVSSGK